METIKELDNRLSEPSTPLIEDLSKFDGDILILGVAGKMGPSLAALAKRALNACGSKNKVIGVSRFSNSRQRTELDQLGIHTIQADLLNEEDLESLPQARYVIFLVGTKFGTRGNECITWTVNSYLPGRVALKYSESSIVAFSTGNVYPLTDVKNGGPTEEDPVGPVGEYAQSCLGRERVFEYFSRTRKIPMLIYRLNYAIDLRYGVLIDIAQAVWNNVPIDLTTGHVNVIWQGDANEIALRSFNLCDTPPYVLNVTGPETLSVRWLAQQYGDRWNKKPQFSGTEASTSLLSNAEKANRMFGPLRVSIEEMIDWTASWVQKGGETHGKPTQFQQRKGAF